MMVTWLWYFSCDSDTPTGEFFSPVFDGLLTGLNEAQSYKYCRKPQAVGQMKTASLTWTFTNGN